MKKAKQTNPFEEVTLDSWQEFYPYVTESLQNPEVYIFREQRMSSWKLESSLDRALRALGPKVNSARVTARHLEQFQLAVKCPRLLYQSQCEFSVDVWFQRG